MSGPENVLGDWPSLSPVCLCVCVSVVTQPHTHVCDRSDSQVRDPSLCCTAHTQAFYATESMDPMCLTDSQHRLAALLRKLSAWLPRHAYTLLYRGLTLTRSSAN